MMLRKTATATPRIATGTLFTRRTPGRLGDASGSRTVRWSITLHLRTPGTFCSHLRTALRVRSRQSPVRCVEREPQKLRALDGVEHIAKLQLPTRRRRRARINRVPLLPKRRGELFPERVGLAHIRQVNRNFVGQILVSQL